VEWVHKLGHCLKSLELLNLGHVSVQFEACKYLLELLSLIDIAREVQEDPTVQIGSQDITEEFLEVLGTFHTTSFFLAVSRGIILLSLLLQDLCFLSYSLSELCLGLLMRLGSLSHG
jgi:hypothetical protein